MTEREFIIAQNIAHLLAANQLLEQVQAAEEYLVDPEQLASIKILLHELILLAQDEIQELTDDE